VGRGPTPRARDFLQTSLLLLLPPAAAAAAAVTCCCSCFFCCCCHLLLLLLLLLPPAAAAAAASHLSLYTLVTGSLSFKVTVSRRLEFNLKRRQPEPGFEFTI
jgi:hypothetical protein